MWETWCEGRWQSAIEQMAVIICTLLSVVFLSTGIMELLHLLGTILDSAWQEVLAWLASVFPVLACDKLG
jgi:hypothetical protein